MDVHRAWRGVVGTRALLIALAAGLALAAGSVRAQDVGEKIAPPGEQPEPKPEAVKPGNRAEGQVVPKRVVRMPGGRRDDVEPAEGVVKLLAQSYLTDEEKKDLRVFHGLWTPEDLDTPARRAGAALASARWDDASLGEEGVRAEDRAEGLLALGELEACLATLPEAADASPRAIRLRAQALEALGRAAEAARAIEPLLGREGVFADAGEQIEAARAMMIRARVSPQDTPAGGDFQKINQMLAEARQRSGSLDWRACLAEGELLYEKNNGEQAQEAAAQALSLNPRCAAAWYLIGRIAVDGFAFDQSDRIARKIDEIAGENNAYSAILRAKAAMRQSDPDTAGGAITLAIARYPRARSLRAVEAAVAALRYDWAGTQTLLDRFDETSPGSADALFEVGKTLSDARQYAESDRYLGLASERAPFRAEPLAERGLMLIQAGRDAEAGVALRRAVELDPFNVRANNSLKLVEELAGYRRIESEHFVVRYKDGPDAALAMEMPEVLERMYRRVTGKGAGGIDHEPSGRTTIDLMPDSRWFAVRIAGVTRIHTMAASTGPCISMETPRVGAGHSVGTYDWLRVVRHEFTHTVTLSRTKNRIPHWFTEAAAVYLEDAPRDFGTIRLVREVVENDALFDMKEINIAFVRPKKPTDRQQAYAQGHLMYEFMIERFGERTPLELMDRYAAGDREDVAMRAVMGMEPSAFLREFAVWARGKLTEWGMGDRPGEPTLGEILRAESIGTDEAREAARQKARERTTGGAAHEADDDAVDGRVPEWSLEIIDRWLAWYPEHPDLLERRVRTALAKNKNVPTAEMAPLLARYAAARPVDPLPRQMLIQLAMGAAGELDERAIEELEFLDAREQGSATYAAELGKAYAARGEFSRALEKANRAAIVAPFEASLRELAATIALRAGDLATAKRHIEALTRIEPDREIHRKRLEAIEAKMRP